jgi:hypothetical protein
MTNTGGETMEDLHPLVSLLALGLFLGFLQFASRYLYGQGATMSSRSTRKSFGGAVGAMTFVGRILQVNGKYVLKDSASQETYLLDDQERAKPFGGRRVKVTGTLDAPNKTIHVL